jgi:hypothetical protein
MDLGLSCPSRDDESAKRVPRHIAGSSTAISIAHIKEIAMLYHCAYTWNQGTTAAQVRQLLAETEPDPGAAGVTVRGYYPFVGGGAGVVLLETDEPEALRAFLVPSFGLVHWDVRAVTEGNWEQELAAARQETS